jgi:hypothetical protein
MVIYVGYGKFEQYAPLALAVPVNIKALHKHDGMRPTMLAGNIRGWVQLDRDAMMRW